MIEIIVKRKIFLMLPKKDFLLQSNIAEMLNQEEYGYSFLDRDTFPFPEVKKLNLVIFGCLKSDGIDFKHYKYCRDHRKNVSFIYIVSTRRQQEAAEQLGINYFFKKPIDLDELLEKIEGFNMKILFPL